MSLSPSVDGDTVYFYFWLVQFYNNIFIPTLVLFPISVVIVVFWFYRLARKLWVQSFVIIISVVIIFLCSLFTFTLATFFPGPIIVGHVEKGGQIYYLVKHYDDLAFAFAFCESDKIGFYGHCRDFGYQGSEKPDPQFFIEQTTGLITVKFDNSPSIFRISIQPTHIYYESAP